MPAARGSDDPNDGHSLKWPRLDSAAASVTISWMDDEFSEPSEVEVVDGELVAAADMQLETVADGEEHALQRRPGVKPVAMAAVSGLVVGAATAAWLGRRRLQQALIERPTPRELERSGAGTGTGAADGTVSGRWAAYRVSIRTLVSQE